MNSTDVTLLNRIVAGIPVSDIPIPPSGLTITPVGPDPAFSIPTDLVAAPGGTVVVPVDIDTAKPDGSTGLTEAVLALTYDPQVFTVSAADIQLGELPDSGTGWQISSVVNARTGEIAVELFSLTPLQSVVGGSLVTITLHARGTAPEGATAVTLVNQVNPTGSRVYTTDAADTQGLLVLHQTATATGTEPGEPGMVTVGGLPSGAFFLGQSEAASTGATAAPVNVGLPAVATGQAALNPNTLPMGLVEQVFADLEKAGLVTQDGMMGQPGVVFDSELPDSPDAALRDQTPLSKQGWAADEFMAQLGQTARQGSMNSTADLLGGAVSGLEDDDLAGLEAFFAHEAKQ